MYRVLHSKLPEERFGKKLTVYLCYIPMYSSVFQVVYIDELELGKTSSTNTNFFKLLVSSNASKIFNAKNSSVDLSDVK